MAGKNPKMPEIKIERKENGQWEMFIDGKLRIAANSIFENKVLDSGNQVAAVCEDGREIKLIIVTLDMPITEFIDINPQPAPGFAVRLLVAKDKKELSLHYRSEKKFHVIEYFHSRMQWRKTASEKKADKWLEEAMKKYPD